MVYILWFILKGVVVADLVSDTAEASTIWDGNICSHLIHLESHSYRKKNEANIVIDGLEYSSDGRGANIVIIDAETFEVVDSVWYDTHDPQDYFKRHVKLQRWDVVIYEWETKQLLTGYISILISSNRHKRTCVL